MKESDETKFCLLFLKRYTLKLRPSFELLALDF